jgi:hypothetical protein
MHLNIFVRFARAGFIAFSLLSVACGDGEDEPERPSGSECPQPEPGEIEIAGTWASNFGGTEQIDSETWGDLTVTEFDNDDNVAITQNADDAETSPGEYNRLVWTEPETVAEACAFYYCWVAFGLDSADAARNSSMTADASDPETGGCGGNFPWTKLSAE